MKSIKTLGKLLFLENAILLNIHALLVSSMKATQCAHYTDKKRDKCPTEIVSIIISKQVYFWMYKHKSGFHLQHPKLHRLRLCATYAKREILQKQSNKAVMTLQ